MKNSKVYDKVQVPSGLGGVFTAAITGFDEDRSKVYCTVVDNADFSGMTLAADADDVRPVRLQPEFANSQYMLVRDSGGEQYLAAIRKHDEGQVFKPFLKVPGLSSYTSPDAAAKGLAQIVHMLCAMDSQLARRPVIKDQEAMAIFEQLMNRIEEGEWIRPLELEDAICNAIQGSWYMPDLDNWINQEYLPSEVPIPVSKKQQANIKERIIQELPDFPGFGKAFVCTGGTEKAAKLIESRLRGEGFLDAVYARECGKNSSQVWGGDLLIDVDGDTWSVRTIRPFISLNREITGSIIKQGRQVIKPEEARITQAMPSN
ncbi:hypothetical protein [Marinospirillum sp.]|uniref:hypothetical protein n=1 Tax=Marinospirillum sp. TaxID=2183934 RepID=UPI0025BB27C3|nr:hypothetical protein [Marinospirillum sp.]